MCHYITLVVGGVDAAALADVMKRHGRVADEVNNASLRRVLRPCEAQFITTRACDCGTALDYERNTLAEGVPSTEKLLRRGWSKAKIDRWLEGKTKAAANAAERSAATHDSAEFWESVIRDVRKSLSPASIGLFLHFYSGGVESEVFEASRVDAGWPYRHPGGHIGHAVS